MDTGLKVMTVMTSALWNTECPNYDRRQTNTSTDRHADHSTPLTYQGRNDKQETPRDRNYTSAQYFMALSYDLMALYKSVYY